MYIDNKIYSQQKFFVLFCTNIYIIESKTREKGQLRENNSKIYQSAKNNKISDTNFSYIKMNTVGDFGKSNSKHT